MPMKNLLRSYVVKIWPLFERFLKLYCEPERNTRSVTRIIWLTIKTIFVHDKNAY